MLQVTITSLPAEAKIFYTVGKRDNIAAGEGEEGGERRKRGEGRSDGRRHEFDRGQESRSS